jgi:hypothetical protein
MQNSHYTNSTTYITGIGSQLEDRMGCGFDEQTIGFLLILAHKYSKLMR